MKTCITVIAGLQPWQKKIETVRPWNQYSITQGYENDCKAYAVLVKDWKADYSRRIDIWEEETLRELALGRLAGVILAEMKGEREVSTLPISLQKK